MTIGNFIPSRWVLMSALQKSIRRNRPEIALAAARHLHQADRRILISRLRVIAVEDIGCGDLPLVHRVLTAAGRAPEQDLLELVDLMCRSIKDRSACDLHGALHTELPGNKWLHTQAALLVGELFQHKPDPLAFEIAEAGLRSTREPLCQSIPAISGMVGPAPAAEPDAYTDLPLIHGWPSEAFDMYTREGKAAYRLFLSRHPEVRQQLNAWAPGKTLALIGYAVFTVESEKLNRRLVFSGSEKIHRLGNMADIMLHGVPLEAVVTVMKLVADHLPAIHEARIASITSHNLLLSWAK